MLKNTPIVLFFLMLIQSCAPAPSLIVTKPFNETDISWSRGVGTGAISGQGFLRQAGGGVVTYAGETVNLIPVSPYSSERMLLIYGNVEKGFNSLSYGTRIIHGALPEGYQSSYRSTSCNAQGNFRFSSLPAGDYFLVTAVRWVAGNLIQGGVLMHRVTVNAQSETDVIVTIN